MALSKAVFIIAGAAILATVAGGAGYLAETHTQAPVLASNPVPTAAAPVAAPTPALSPQVQTTAPSPSPLAVENQPPQAGSYPAPAPLQETALAENVVVQTPPPPLPIYVVPAPPAPNLLWTPGHWRWNGAGYYWVPGTWVQPPVVGVLWTPGYWQSAHGSFAWHEGYWGPHVGFYGGINYGGGYIGIGFHGGAWNGNRYAVNRAVTNVSTVTNVTNITNVRNVTNTTTTTNNTTTSFNGGPGGTSASPSAEQQAAANEKHFPPTQEQTQHAALAAKNPELLASANHGTPPVAATAKPTDFDHGVAAAKPSAAEKPQTQHSLPQKGTEKAATPLSQKPAAEKASQDQKSKASPAAASTLTPHSVETEKASHAAPATALPSSSSKPDHSPTKTAPALAKTPAPPAKKPQAPKETSHEQDKKEDKPHTQDDTHVVPPQHPE